MPKINQFNRVDLNVLRAELNAAFSGIENKYGINLSLGVMRYDESNVNVKLSMKTEGAVVASQDFPNKGIKFVHKGKTYTVTAYNPRSFKYPYVGVGQDGKSYKFMESTVERNQLVKQKLR